MGFSLHELSELWDVLSLLDFYIGTDPKNIIQTNKSLKTLDIYIHSTDAKMDQNIRYFLQISLV